MKDKRRLDRAEQYLIGAEILYKNGDFGGCVSRSYYAAYQAMWFAMGDPERKPRWEHLGIIKSFVRGVWYDPKVPARGPGLFEKYRFPLHRLYDLRLGADYRLDDIKEREAIWAIETTKEIMQTIKGR
jgi:uncharacterized protein (UPF0332 family)